MWSLLVVLCLSFKVDPKTGFIRDEDGRAAIFHGVNVVYKTPPFIPVQTDFDPQLSLSDVDIEYFQEWGFNIVRLGVIWQAVESKFGQYNTTYLQEVNKLITKLGQNGIYTLVDSHQDLFANRFCGQGMPDAYIPELQHSCFSHWFSTIFSFIGLCKSMDSYHFIQNSQGNPLNEDCLKNLFYFYYMSPEVNSLFYSFYTNSTTQKAFLSQWEAIVSTIGQNPYVLGYDPLNEPWPGNFFEYVTEFIPGVVDYQYLQPLYKQYHQIVRKYDQDHIIAFEPVQFPDTLSHFIFPVGFSSTPGGSQFHDRELLNAHTYCCEVSATMCANGEPPLEDALTICRTFHKNKVDRRAKDARNLGVGLIFSEFGACSGSEACVAEITGSTQAFDEHSLSWSYWQYKGFNDITTTGSQTQGLFNPDGSIQTNKVKALTRPYLQKTQGTPGSMYFDLDNSYFTASFQVDSSIGKPTEVYLNEELHYSGGYKMNVNNGQPDVQQGKNMVLVQYAAGSEGTTYITITPKRKYPFNGVYSGSGVSVEYSISESLEGFVKIKSVSLEGYQVGVQTAVKYCDLGNECIFESHQMYQAVLVMTKSQAFLGSQTQVWKIPALNGEELELTLNLNEQG